MLAQRVCAHDRLREGLLLEEEPESLMLLRHRFGRTIEVWTAYTVFLERQVEVGSDRVCMNDLIVEQTTHTLNMVFYSFVYSLFDKSGVSFPKATQPLLDRLSPLAREARALVVDAERKIHSELSKIRNNIGFHGGAAMKNHRSGYRAYASFHPGEVDVIMQGMRVFFREAEKSFTPAEPYANQPDDEVTVEIMELCRSIRREIDETDGEGLGPMFEALGRRLSARRETAT